MYLKRSSESQSFHDQVVKLAANNINHDKYDVYTNPNGEQNTGVSGQYPDIILAPKGTKNVSFIIEVETADSITLSEAQTQWAAYSKLGGTFYLLVPSNSLETAKQLCRQANIQPKFAIFWVSDGRLQVKYNP